MEKNTANLKLKIPPFQNNVDMTCSLVDSEDYPRSDVDVYKIRTARGRINCLQNDLNTLIKEISSGLENHFSEMSVNTVDQTMQQMKTTSEQSGEKDTSKSSSTATVSPHKDPFSVITAISDGSPSHDAGLRVHDQIVEFGSLNGKNYEALKQFADIAEHKLNKPVTLVVKRKRDGIPVLETIQLVPKKWSGRGYLGMVVKPM